MHIAQEQFQRIEGCFPTQRGNVKISNLTVLDAIVYVAESGCTWRSLPKRFGGWNTMTPGQWGDGPAGRELLRGLPQPEDQVSLIMDRAYQGNATRQLAFDRGFDPVVPPHPKRRHPRSINQHLYRRRNEIERLFRRLEAFRRIFSCYDKLDVVFSAFLHFALIAEALGPRFV